MNYTLETVWQCLREKGIPDPVAEFRFHPTRRWRWDFAWPERMLCMEVDGGLYVSGRHSRGAGREKDMEKFAEGMILGWRVLAVSPRIIRDGRAARWIEKLYQNCRR